ncbi:hypothetical protein A3H80_00450 [Candidatus Roizmanbacteria bacterium RIFCSPLOWO2_02_FULL_37_19]|uniref:Aspartyl/glutamyl-tRNA(Asn/Gln) amidotransferase subunit B n=1 Tax=Candidatus Roizmanbacteria bacterium RIFCSPHIGHO2_02_FULL_37_24 TaxID=1802037 RepID=A0A1F7GY12_9BACT|nr:MAG: hypothetical protein A2862_04930 [Candidatus Roizmanbacteria bacterium RIFCSPHIGHO2_01_FULL_38_41]OGK23753.1 MAG: hypothetical protein A3C24_04915 [Candidatus Roizmanbacteria bacterium RIFCSPHIGHO2_02_FULL_37_24]OGK32674.1 MAG: hypothetical protein A3E10_01630 [Candidatus Roizmanbacteria bacterium RIFCSPHIGHO2_12_FULL_37_23]OGK44760.1 MAG: hypothetical protein A2956_01520 [Candidatus Roizmanbacteria bacterium RIFCSPLOWO2_01_FULL_37_57]OGK53988.1 MAG: hypothetical protein A3H80_00450 [Ca
MNNQKEFIPVIGLEIHVQLATKTKLFDRGSADWFGKKPNTVVGPLALGLPGTLPVPNKKAIQWAMLLGKSLNCKINKISKFDRKHYFYPDLPKAYQISQYDQPFSYDGYFEFISPVTGTKKNITITRVHLEEDTGKLIHQGNETLIDFNRSGVPLAEIVTEPDFDNSDDVKRFLEELQVHVRYLGISDADMEKGSMRLEPNISVRHRKSEQKLPNYKVEIKNINSFRYAKQAIEFEIKRQEHLIRSGETPVQETRGYDEFKGVTFSQRRKEGAEDYRYFPEPDIPPFIFDDDFLKVIDDMMPELPHERLARFIAQGIKPGDAYVLTRSKSISDTYELIIKEIKSSVEKLTHKSKTLEGEIAKLIVNKKVSIEKDTRSVIKEIIQQLTPQETNEEELIQVIESVIETNQKPVQDFKNGKENSITFLIGQVMKTMKGKADPVGVRKSLEKKLTDT